MRSVINDGSKDDTLSKVIAHFQMYPIEKAVNYSIACNPVRGVYKSNRKAYNKLVMVDKMNGGKADALNAGINIAKGNIFIATDVDSFIQKDAIQRMIKPFIDSNQERIIAVGAAVRVANSCNFEEGTMIDVLFAFKARFFSATACMRCIYVRCNHVGCNHVYGIIFGCYIIIFNFSIGKALAG